MADEGEDKQVTFHVKSSSDAKYTLTLPVFTTVLDLKSKLAGPDYADVSPDRQRLIYSGRVLKDTDTLDTHKIKDGNTVHLVRSAASNQRQNPATHGASGNTANTGASGGGGDGASQSSGVPTNLAAGTGNNPLAGLTGGRYAGLAQLPGAGMFGPDGGMGAPPDPEQLAAQLSNPQFASTLNEALQNPQVIDMMIQQNPMLRDMGPAARQMLQSPEFRRMMTDPEYIRSMTQMSRMMGMSPFGGMGGQMGGGGAGGSFPAPGVTDTTPQQPQDPSQHQSGEGQRGEESNQQGNQQAQPPPNPFAMFGAPGGAGGAGGDNPFAALFNQGQGPGQGQGQGGQTPGQQGQPGQPGQQANPFGGMFNPANNPLLQNPQAMQQMMNAMMGGGAAGGPGGAAPGAGAGEGAQPGAGGAGGFNPFGFLGNGGGNGTGGGFGGGTPPPPDNRPPEERYADQLRQLNDMGFYDFDQNVAALRRTGGSVQGAIEHLLSS